MTKTATASTQSPLFTAVGQDVVNAEGSGASQGLRGLARALHWAFVYRRECHLSMACGAATWDDYPSVSCASAPDNDAVETLGAIATGSNVEWIDTDLWIDADTAALGSLELGAECDVTAAANTVRVTFVLTGGLGSASPYVDCTQAENDTEVSTTQALSGITAGDEWVRCQIQIQRTAGAATNELRHVRVQEAELSIGSVPDPQDT